MTTIAYTRTSAKTPLADDFATSLELFRQRTGHRATGALVSSEDAGDLHAPKRLLLTTTGRASGVWLLSDEGDTTP